MAVTAYSQLVRRETRRGVNGSFVGRVMSILFKVKCCALVIIPLYTIVGCIPVESEPPNEAVLNTRVAKNRTADQAWARALLLTLPACRHSGHDIAKAFSVAASEADDPALVFVSFGDAFSTSSALVGELKNAVNEFVALNKDEVAIKLDEVSADALEIYSSTFSNDSSSTARSAWLAAVASDTKCNAAWARIAMYGGPTESEAACNKLRANDPTNAYPWLLMAAKRVAESDTWSGIEYVHRAADAGKLHWYRSPLPAAVNLTA